VADGREAIVAALRSIHDPCCAEKGISVVDMGLIRDIEFDERGVRVELILTSGWCPFAVDLLTTVKERVQALGIDEAAVEVRWDEPWSSDRLSPSARAKLRFLPDPRSVRDRSEYMAELAPMSPGAPNHAREQRAREGRPPG
jgi:metal-sulfur cluster biosynthetic enzyme